MYSRVLALEALDLGFLLYVGANHAGAGEVFLRAAEMSENIAWMRSKRSWILRPKYCTTMLTMGSGRKANSVSRGLMRQHESQRAGGEHDRVGRVHDGRPEQACARRSDRWWRGP